MNDAYFVYEQAQKEKLELEKLELALTAHRRAFLNLCNGSMGVIDEDWEKKNPNPFVWGKEPLYIKENLLEIGEVYFGDHRCTNIAVWTGTCFVYIEKNMGCWGFEETETLEDRDKKNNYAFFTPFFLAKNYNNIDYVNKMIEALKVIYKEWIQCRLNTSL
jgi:hypothetical protein